MYVRVVTSPENSLVLSRCVLTMVLAIIPRSSLWPYIAYIAYLVCATQEGGKFIPELEDQDSHPTSSKVSTPL